MGASLSSLTVENLVPHRGAMSWLDEVISVDDASVHARSTIRSDRLFVRDGLVGAWVGVEFMAQAVAAWAGHRARSKGGVVNIGFLLGTRRYEITRPQYAVGDVLDIEARCELMGDNGLGMFSCCIRIDGETVAEANLSVFEPPDGAHFEKTKGEST